MIRIRVYVAAIISILILSSCSDLRGPAEERDYRARHAGADDPIVIGAAAPWEVVSGLGYYREGLEMALAEINEQKVLKRKLEIVWRDDESSISKARSIAQEFSENPDMVAVVGHYQSSITVPVSLIYQHYGMLLLNATSTSTKLTSRDGLDLVFRNIPNDRQVASQLADFALKQGYRRMVVINEDNDFGDSLANAFENRSGQIGLNVVDRRLYDHTTGESQFRRIIDNWKKFYHFDAVFLAGVVPKAAEFIRLMREMGVEVPIIGGDGLDSPMLWEIGGELVNGVIVGTYFHPHQPGNKTQEFVRAFKRRYGAAPDAWAAQSYATLHLLARAMRRSGTTVPDEVAQSLRNMERFEGVLGGTGFNEKGDLLGRSITTKIVRNEAFEYLGLH